MRFHDAFMLWSIFRLVTTGEGTAMDESQRRLQDNGGPPPQDGDSGGPPPQNGGGGGPPPQGGSCGGPPPQNGGGGGPPPQNGGDGMSPPQGGGGGPPPQGGGGGGGGPPPENGGCGGPPPENGGGGGPPIAPPGGSRGGGATECSDRVANYRSPSTTTAGACLEATLNQTFRYPEDFGELLNQVTVYECPTSNQRIFLSNAIPNHDITVGANAPCALNWYVAVPLQPSLTEDGSSMEPAALGIVAMTLNGVPSFGAQEGGGTNAVEGERKVPAWGHASPGGFWHYHSGEFGRADLIVDVPEETLLGYALDGFPIYGPLEDDSVLDSCNGIMVGESYQYHVRTRDQVNETAAYCDGTRVMWPYVVGCFRGKMDDTLIGDSTNLTVPSDCVLIEDSSAAGSGPVAAPVADEAPTSGSFGMVGSGFLTLLSWSLFSGYLALLGAAGILVG